MQLFISKGLFLEHFSTLFLPIIMKNCKNYSVELRWDSESLHRNENMTTQSTKASHIRFMIRKLSKIFDQAWDWCKVYNSILMNFSNNGHQLKCQKVLALKPIYNTWAPVLNLQMPHSEPTKQLLMDGCHELTLACGPSSKYNCLCSWYFKVIDVILKATYQL